MNKSFKPRVNKRQRKKYHKLGKGFLGWKFRTRKVVFRLSAVRMPAFFSDTENAVGL